MANKKRRLEDMSEKEIRELKLKIFKKLLPKILRDAERDMGIRSGSHELTYFEDYDTKKKKLKKVM